MEKRKEIPCVKRQRCWSWLSKQSVHGKKRKVRRHRREVFRDVCYRLMGKIFCALIKNFEKIYDWSDKVLKMTNRTLSNIFDRVVASRVQFVISFCGTRELCCLKL